MTIQASDFRFHYLLGQGVYGNTFLTTKQNGEDRGKKYAMKVSGKDKIAWSTQELDILKRLNRCNFSIKITYAFQNPYATFLCMELAHGGDLTVLNRLNINLDHAGVLFYATEILSGIIEIHRLGVIHRDIKPENILLTQEGHIRIADFGTSLIVQQGEGAYEFKTSPFFAVSINS